jgi:hypothetical protein
MGQQKLTAIHRVGFRFFYDIIDEIYLNQRPLLPCLAKNCLWVLYPSLSSALLSTPHQHVPITFFILVLFELQCALRWGVLGKKLVKFLGMPAFTLRYSTRGLGARAFAEAFCTSGAPLRIPRIKKTDTASS